MTDKPVTAEKLYTAAYVPGGVLVALEPDDKDIDAAVAEEADNYGDGWDAMQIEFKSGLTLTDELEDGEEAFWTGHSVGFITDEHGHYYRYMVERAA